MYIFTLSFCSRLYSEVNEIYSVVQFKSLIRTDL